jgi:hypothetical protein
MPSMEVESSRLGSGLLIRSTDSYTRHTVGCFFRGTSYIQHSIPMNRDLADSAFNSSESEAGFGRSPRQCAGTLTGVKATPPLMRQHAGVKTAVETNAPAGPAPTAPAKSQTSASRRLGREWKTIAAMIQVYCSDHHRQPGLCPECRQLLDYAGARLERCRFGAEKPTCANCPVHCYQPRRREQVRTVMRYAGPRMLWRHPLLSLNHRLDSFRKAPAVKWERSNGGLE